MRNELTDFDVLTFALAGCNAAEVAEFAGTSVELAQARLDRVIEQHRRLDPNPPKPRYLNRGAVA